MKKLTCLLVPLLTIACSSGDANLPAAQVYQSNTGCNYIDHIFCNQIHFNVIIDNSFSTQDQINIYDALADWSVKTNESLDLDIKVSNPASMADDSNQIHTINIFIRDPGPMADGWTEMDFTLKSARIHIRQDIDPLVFSPVMKHELGHAFLLFHYNGSMSSIMHPIVGPEQDITCLDVKDFCQIWGCQSSCRLIPDQKFLP